MRKEFVIITLAIFLIATLGFIIADSETELENETVVCAQDVQLCDDGTYVSRDPENNCEFYSCPEAEEEEETELEDDENETELEDEEELEEDDEQILGASCGTVSPGYQTECCERKGYEGWDEEAFECFGERNRENIRQRIRIQNQINQTECPEECACSGSTIKCSFENGTRIMTVYAGNSGNVIIQIKNLNMSTNVTLYKGENGKLYGVFEDNETKEIKLPDEVMEKLRERNQKRLQLYDESINLTDDGYYQVQTKKKARLFLLIPVREHVQAEVNAETGEVIKVRNPWWGFLARDVKEDTEDEEEDSEQETED